MKIYKIKATPGLKRTVVCALLLILMVGFLCGFFTARWTTPQREVAVTAQNRPTSTYTKPKELYPEPSQTSQETIPAPTVSIAEEPLYIPDREEVEALARMLYGEARGIESQTEKAACVWCVLNRVDDPRFPDSVIEVLEAPHQFVGYSRNHPLLDELMELAADVLTRYHAEKDGESDVGRILPSEYCFFIGDGKHNHFVSEWNSSDTWQWSLSSPYEN